MSWHAGFGGNKLQSIKCWSLLHSFEDQGGGIHHTQKRLKASWLKREIDKYFSKHLVLRGSEILMAFLLLFKAFGSWDGLCRNKSQKKEWCKWFPQISLKTLYAELQSTWCWRWQDYSLNGFKAMLAAKQINWSKPKCFMLFKMERNSWGNSVLLKWNLKHYVLMFKLKAQWAGPIQSSKSWQSSWSFFHPTLVLALVVVGCHLTAGYTLVEALGPHHMSALWLGIDLSKGWVTLPPANHGLAASPIPGSVGSNTLESLVLPPFSVGVWFYTWPHSNRLWPFSQPSFAISSEIGGPALVLGSALGLALVALAFPLGLTGCWCWCRPSCWLLVVVAWWALLV